MYGWGPQDIDNMTLPEIGVACRSIDKDEETKEKQVYMSQVLPLIRALSASERLALARWERDGLG